MKKEDIELIVRFPNRIVILALKTKFFFFIFVLQVNEILISRQQAEKVLREHRDVVSALEALIN